MTDPTAGKAEELTALQKLEQTLGLLSNMDELITRTTRLRDEKLAPLLALMKPILDQYDPLIQQYEADRAVREADVARIFTDNREELLPGDSKTVDTANGKVSARFGAVSVNISDKATAMRYTKQRRMLTKVTKKQDRVFVKDKLKEVPDFVEECPGMNMTRKETLHITLKNKVVITKELGETIVPLPAD